MNTFNEEQLNIFKKDSFIKDAASSQEMQPSQKGD